MDFAELVRRRYSVRDFADRPVGEESLRLVLEAARQAPTAGNRQPQKIYVLKSPEALARIRSVTRYAFNAPLVLMICADENVAWKNSRETGYSSAEMDASIACTLMMLQAHALGLGTVWVRGYRTADVEKEFPLPAGERLVCLLPLGYPAEGSRPAAHHFERKPLEDLVAEL